MVLEFLKKGYYFLEDKYYALLDKINRVIPVYRIVDPIDKHFPSFVLFLLLLLLLLLFLLSFALPGFFSWIFPSGGGGTFNAKIKVLDDETKKPIKDANATIVFIDSNKSVSKTTDSDGFAVFEIPSKEAKVSLHIRATGYEDLFRSTVTLSSETVSSFTLKHGAILFKPKVKMTVFDGVSKELILDRTVSIDFSCSGSSTVSLPRLSGMQNALVPFEIEVPEGCGVLSGTAKVDGYKSLTQILTSGYESAEVRFVLTPVTDEVTKKGSLSVQVLDNLGSPASNILVKLTNETTNAYVTSDYTKDSGSVVFNDLVPGKYSVFADAGDGRTATQSGVQVVSGQTASTILRLPSFAGHVKKLYLKVVDANKNSPIGGAQVIIYMNELWFKTVDTNSDGTALVWLGPQDVSKSFKANVSAKGYIMKIVSLPVLDYADTAPTIVSLSPEVVGQNFNPIAILIANRYAGNAPLTVEFDASQSFDPEGKPIVSYDLNLGDGNWANTAKKTHTYYKDGNYEVTLSVRDDRNAVGTKTITIQVVPVGQNFAPIALFTMKPYYGYAPLTVDFNAEPSIDYDGSIQSYQWSFGDGSNGTGRNVSHSYANPGEYTIWLFVVDDKGAQSKISAKLQVLPKQAVENLKPIAFISVDNNAYFGAVPFTVSFDASASYDPDGTIVNYKWNFGDGSATAIEEGPSKAKVSHVFAKTGVFNVTLEVKDNNNATATQSVAIQVLQGPTNWKPVARIDANVFHGMIPLEVEFSAAKSFDSDGSIVFYRWDFGDGSPQVDGLNKVSVKHVFSSAGDFTVSLMVRDDDGAESTDSVVIQAYSSSSPPENLKPVALFEASSYFGVKPLSVSFDASASFDPDGSIQSYQWNFGDGGTATGKITSHVFNSVGEFTVELKVTDGKGAQGTHTAKIQVIGASANLNPVPKITASGLFGQKPFKVDFTADGSFDPDGSIQSYQWNFGDGGTATTKDASHTFQSTGSFEVKLTVKDNSGATATTSVFVQVVDWPVVTYGDILAKTETVSGQPVQGALLQLYREDLTIPLTSPTSPVYSGPGGTHLFEKIPESISKYYFKGFYNDLAGESSHKHVVPASTIELKAVLSPTEGRIAVKVLKNGAPVQGATVSFLKVADSSVLGTCTTSVDGNCLSNAIKGGEIVKVTAQKAGSAMAESNDIQVIAGNIHSVTLSLEDAPVTGINAVFEMFCEDSQCNSPASSITSLPAVENYYYLKFKLVLAAKTSQNTRLAVVASDFNQSVLPASNYRVKIVDVLDNSVNAKLLATCFDKNNLFETVPACTGPGSSFKHSVSVWNTLSSPTGLSKTVILKIAIEPGLAAGTASELRFAAKTRQDNNDLNTAIILIPLIIGAPVCSGDQNLVWTAHTFVDGAKIELPLDPAPEKFAVLKKNSDYNIFFTVKNCSSQDISNLKIRVLNKNDDNCLAFTALGGGFGPYEAFTIPVLAAGAVSDEKRIEIRAVKSTDRTRVVLTGVFGSKEESRELFFKVVSDKNLLVENLPNFLVQGVPIAISGKVLDAKNALPVVDAIVQILLNNNLLVELKSDSNGNFSFNQSSGMPPVAGDKVTVIVRKAGYYEFLKDIPVTAGGSPSMTECVKIEPKAVSVVKGSNGSFDVITTNCPKKLTVVFATQLSMPLQQITLDGNAAKTVSFSASGANIFQGIYPIVVKGSFEGSSYERHLGIVDVTVTDPNACISMDKFEFDLLAGTATATIKNNCFVENRTTEFPIIISNNAGVELKKTDPKDNIPASFSFTWSIESYAKQEEGNDFSVASISKTVTVSPANSLIFELDTFNAADYINGNASKGISGLKQSPNYKGKLLLEAWFVPKSSSPEVEVWIEGGKIIGKYHGPLETTGIYPISISNKMLTQTEYSKIAVEDLSKGGGG
ncbi:MAG: PKD domain-containing protein [Candidatus Diapherotrites archaeon]